jgi:hypothetical protein
MDYIYYRNLGKWSITIYKELMFSLTTYGNGFTLNIGPLSLWKMNTK